MSPHEEAGMEEILDCLQEATYGLSELHWRLSRGSMDVTHLDGFLSNARRVLIEAVTELSLIEATIAIPAA